MDKRQYIRNIVRGILTENANKNQIINAIKRRHEIKLVYDDLKGDNGIKDSRGGKQLRVIQPVAYGLSKSGNEIIRAYQIMGSTKTFVPHWKTFLVSNIVKWTEMNKTFQEPPKFNKKGDKDMTTIYTIADFEGAEKKYNGSGLQRYNQEKQGNFPILGKLRNDRHYKAKDFDYIQRNIDNWKKPENFDSAWEMAQAQEFGDEGFNLTDEPVKKNNYSTTSNIDDNRSYGNVVKNSPINKGSNNVENEEEEDNE